MSESAFFTTSRDKLLFTPGPLTTSMNVKRAMLHDVGSRDHAFQDTIQDVRDRLLAIAGLTKSGGYEAVLLPGSGTYGLESVVSSVVPKNGKLLVIINGAYGKRIASIASIHDISLTCLEYSEDQPPDPEDVQTLLRWDEEISHVFVVHCETTTGIMNPIDRIGAVVKRMDRTYCVDSMSAFGATPFDFEGCGIDFLVSSSNKCIEGVPGFSFVICKRKKLLISQGLSRTLSLNLYEQWDALETTGQFRFTPPTHAILAFHQALIELEREGGVSGRYQRYLRNSEVLDAGMAELGFQALLDPEHRCHIIMTYYCPSHTGFRFQEFYNRLHDKGFVIYPGKVSKCDCFRVGSIGRLDERDMVQLLRAMKDVLDEMNIYL